MIRNQINSTIRNIKRNKISSVIKVFGLVISIITVIIIWLYVGNENKYDKGISNSNRIFRLEAQWASMPPYIGHLINQQVSGNIIATRLSHWEDVGIQVNKIPFNFKDLILADSTFFKVFPFEFLEGNAKNALLLPFSIVFTESQAKFLFGTTHIIGKVVRLENQFDFTVTGVIKDQPYIHFKMNGLASIVSLEKIAYKGVLEEFDGWSYPTYVLLPDNSHAKENEIKIVNLLKNAGYNNTSFFLKPFDNIYYASEAENESNTKHGNLLYNKILIAISIFILLLASINFINLTIAHALSRTKEVSIKKMQGASFFQLIQQFLFEIIVIVFAAFIISLFLISALSPLLQPLLGFSIKIAELLHFKNVIILVSGFIGFVIITGIYPSIYISSFSYLLSKNKGTGLSDQKNFRNGLIIFQNMISIVLICCTLIVYQQFRFMNRKNLGFDRNEIVNLKVDARLMDHLDMFKQSLLKYPQIMSVSYSNRIPGNYWGSWCCVKISGIEGKEHQFFDNFVDADYLKTMGIRLKDGHNISQQPDNSENIEYLINETALKLYDIKNPIGKLITGNGRKGYIAGVISDFHYRGLNYNQTPVLLLYEPDRARYINIKIDKNDVTNALKNIKKTWEKTWPEFAFDYHFLNETYDLQYKSEKKFGELIFSFAILALLIASIGLFGLSIHSAERRTKEIGIHKVNGASIIEILGVLNEDYVKWIIVAFIVACPIAWYTMNKWLENFVYKIDIGWFVFLLAGLIAAFIAFFTVSFRSYRAATRNPVEALRYE